MLVSGPPGSELRTVQERARRGLLWRLCFIVPALALFIGLSAELNAMRLYTISTAPSYVPMAVIQYWIASGVLIGVLLTLGAEMFIFALKTDRQVRKVRAASSTPGRGTSAASTAKDPST